MPVTIFWFSGTGNSYFVARNITDGMSGQLVPIAAVIEQEEIAPEAEQVGIVFPVYFGELPNIIETFALKLRGLAGKYVFAVATYGGGRGGSFERLAELLRKNGGTLSAMFGVHMPQNAFRKFWEKPGPLYKNALRMTRKICCNIAEGKTGLYTTSWTMDVLQKLVYPWTVTANRKFFLEAAKGTPDEARIELLYRLDNTFTVTEACTGCGTCVKICPVGNIILKEEKPEWQHRCANCISCYNYCPNQAIESTMIKKGYYYRHPDFSPIKDLKMD